MAISPGTTSRQLEWLARWALAVLVIVGMLAWWWPAYSNWAAASGGLLLVLVLWLLWRTVAADRTVPGHPIHLVLLVPWAILIWHLAGRGLTTVRGESWRLRGALDLSMAFEFALLALGVMLSQSLLPQAARHAAVVGACGAAMMGGMAAAMVWGAPEAPRTALALLGFAGVCVWLSIPWLAGGGDGPTAHGAPLGGAAPRHGSPGGTGRRAPWLRWLHLAVAALAASALTVIAPLQGLLMAGIAAATLFLTALICPQRRAARLLAGGALAAAVATALVGLRWVRDSAFELITCIGQGSPLGRGEEAFAHVSARDSGVVVLAGTIGWVGACVFVAGLAACIAALLVRVRRSPPAAQVRAMLWVAAAGAISAAFLSAGGMFIPAVVLAAAFIWGLLPAMVGRPQRRHGGLCLVVGVGIMLILGGLAAEPGLMLWMPRAVGWGDAFLHTSAGFFLAMLLAWLLGARRVLPGLLGIAAAALAGVAGELLQYRLSTRAAEFGDSLHHAAGAAAVVLPYLLCMGCRWCESPDVQPTRPEERVDA